MSQHDYNIANGGGAAVRADINNALLAILSQNSGATAPTTTKPFMFWYDTTTGVLKMRNAADTAWIAAIDGISNGNPTGLKNRILNGSMAIDQRNAGASYAAIDGGYSLDRWQCISYDGSAQTGKYTVQQNAGSVTPPAGYINYLGVTSSAATSLGSGAQYLISQNIEGLNAADLGWGTASAQTVTLSFWVRSSLTGTFGGAVCNASVDRSYPFSYTVNAANTWEQKSVTIAGDTSGTWLKTNSIGIRLRFGLGVGSSVSGTANSWAAGAYYSVTGATNVVGTNGATFYITGVQLEKGSTATSFDYRPYGTELALCQRYFWNQTGGDGGANYASVASGVFNGTTTARTHVKFPVTMRAAPTMAIGGTLSAQGGGVGFAVTGINGTNTGTNASMVDFTVSGATSGQGTVIYLNNASTNYLQASAEL